MRLLDDFERDYQDCSGHNEDTFTFLNRSAKPVFATARETLEDWFQRYPSSAQLELRSRFQDTNSDRNQRSAFFELFLHETLFRQGCRIEIHPSCGINTDRKPDFLVELP